MSNSDEGYGRLGLIVRPETGEVLTTLGDKDEMRELAQIEPEIIAAYIADIDDQRSQLDAARFTAQAYLVERLDLDATQTLHAGPYKIEVNGSSDEVEAYDGGALREALAPFVSAGTISDAAASHAVTVKLVAAKSGINKLRALRNDDIDAAIAATMSVSIRPRRVKISRGG